MTNTNILFNDCEESWLFLQPCIGAKASQWCCQEQQLAFNFVTLTICTIDAEDFQEGGGSSGTYSNSRVLLIAKKHGHGMLHSSVSTKRCSMENWWKLLLQSAAEKDARSKEEGVFGDLSSLSDFFELSQSHNRCRKRSKRLDFEVMEHRSRKLLPSNQVLQS